MVAVVERGGVFVVLLLLFFFYFLFFWLTIKVNFDCKKLFIAKVVVWLYGGFDSWLYRMAFCPSIFKLSFWFYFFPFVGAFVGEVDFDDLEANLFFAVRFLWRGRSF